MITEKYNSKASGRKHSCRRYCSIFLEELRKTSKTWIRIAVLGVIFGPRPLEYETEFLQMPSDKLHLIDVSLTHPLCILVCIYTTRRASYRC
jgi:hypothetical protein